jgi:minor extracellular serine protease Vpr
VLSGAVLTAPSIAPVGVLSAAGLEGPSGDASKGQYLPGSQISPGSLARVYGNFLIGGTSDGATVRLGGMPAPVFGASSGQITFQVPWELAGQSQADLAVTVNEQTTAPPLTIALQPVAPGIFSVDGTGSGQGAIYDLSGRLVDASNPAIAGSTIIQIYCTGLGAVTNPLPTGAVAPAGPLSRTTSIPSVTFDYAYGASVLYSGLAPGLVGVYQVNALVPNGLRSSPSLIVRVAFGGITSNTVSIAIK